MKRFTVEEAEAMIPALEKIFEAVESLAAQAQSKADRIRARDEAPAAEPAQQAIEKSQVQFLANEIERRLQEIIDLGAVPKGLEPALVDFPSRVDGRDVFLCWKLGEKSITAYHGAEDGFSARRPLPRRRPS